MPLLYGEGHKAFLRLHREILSTIEDDTIFLGGLAPRSALNVWYFTCNTENHFLATPGNLCDESVASIRPLPSNADRMTTQWHSSAGKLQRNDPKKDPRLRGDVVSSMLSLVSVSSTMVVFGGAKHSYYDGDSVPKAYAPLVHMLISPK